MSLDKKGDRGMEVTKDDGLYVSMFLAEADCDGKKMTILLSGSALLFQIEKKQYRVLLTDVVREVLEVHLKQ